MPWSNNTGGGNKGPWGGGGSNGNGGDGGPWGGNGKNGRGGGNGGGLGRLRRGRPVAFRRPPLAPRNTGGGGGGGGIVVVSLDVHALVQLLLVLSISGPARFGGDVLRVWRLA